MLGQGETLAAALGEARRLARTDVSPRRTRARRWTWR
jgi:hypothetical protein